MATIQDRPFSKDYSGLINQSVIAGGIIIIAIASHEYMGRKRRGTHYRVSDGLGSVESWQFGYLYQGRSWAKNPSPPLPLGWALSWVRPVLSFPEDRFNELRGVDASVYIRFLKGCSWFTFAHTISTLPILFPIHVEFSEDSISRRSMTRASISSLVDTTKGRSLLWIHLVLLIWVTVSWIYTLYWIACGAFRFRAQKIQELADRVQLDKAVKDAQYYPHPHPQYPFQDTQPMDEDGSTRGIRLRTVMVSNIPPNLRTEKDLKEYFEYYLSHQVAKPSMGVTSTTQPGFLNRTFAFLFNRARHIPSRLQKSLVAQPTTPGLTLPVDSKVKEIPTIDRVVLVRKMSDLASLLERREEVLRLLETSHIKLARKAVAAVKEAMEAKPHPGGFIQSATSRLSFAKIRSRAPTPDIENGRQSAENTIDGEDRMQLLIRTLGPYVNTSSDSTSKKHPLSWIVAKWGLFGAVDPDAEMKSPITFPSPSETGHAPTPNRTIWDALLSLPRSALDSFQPLIHLSALFRGRTVPSIDYYTAKLNLLTSLITEKRAKAVNEYAPTSTAFVTFKDPADARRACKYLAVHPDNPVNACFVTMAPSYEDLDWTRLMKATYRVEFVKDWVVNLGVWAFTIFWVFPVSLLVTLVSIQNISAFWPGLKRYLDQHQWEEELIQSFLPTLLVALLALLIPLLLLLIAKKAHTISTLSTLHDRIMTRYYKFLIVNVLVFFCIGVTTLQSFLVSFSQTTGSQIITVVSTSFPTAGPFYVGWMIFTMGIHGGLELALFGLPLIMYPSTKRQITPRKRAVGIRPRTFNYYYWLPNHLLVIHVLLVFSLLNPLVIPFAFLYFCVEMTVVKNQLLHVYAKNYEGNGKYLLIRLIRYSLDGLILSQVVFLAYMVVLKKTANVVVTAILVVITSFVKMAMTRVCRARYERDDIWEADIICGTDSSRNLDVRDPAEEVPDAVTEGQERASKRFRDHFNAKTDFWTLKLANRMSFLHGPRAKAHMNRRQPNPFRPQSPVEMSSPLASSSSTAGLLEAQGSPSNSPPPVPVIESSRPLQEEPEEMETRTPLVISHSPHSLWDDTPSYDRPYDNPYYAQPIRDALWLPRDPTGLLDLDDTVDLLMALTSEASAGKIGTWGEEAFIGSSISSVLLASFGDLDEDEDLSVTPAVRTLDGSEIINLPSAIASRVENIDQESDVEHTSPNTKPSILAPPRRQSSSSTNPSITFRRPSTLDVGANPAGFRSFSLGVEAMATAGLTPSTGTSSSDPRRRNRAATLDNGMGLRPPVRQGSSAHATRSLLSVVENPTFPVMTHSTTSNGEPSVITTQEAVVGEVIKEEKDLTQERIRQEEAEKQKAEGHRSWWTSWIYARGQ